MTQKIKLLSDHGWANVRGNGSPCAKCQKPVTGTAILHPHISDVRAHCGRIGGLSKSERKRAASSANMRKAQAIRAERQRKARLDADGEGQSAAENV